MSDESPGLLVEFSNINESATGTSTIIVTNVKKVDPVGDALCAVEFIDDRNDLRVSLDEYRICKISPEYAEKARDGDLIPNEIKPDSWN